MKKTYLTAMALAGAMSLIVGCSNSTGQSESPVFLTVSIELQPGFINVANAVPVQLKTIKIDSHRKNPDSVDTLGFSDVQLNSYTVTFRRTDGGTTVPPMQTFGCGVVVPHDGTSTLENFPVLYAADVQQTPFDQLLPFNGGIDRQTGRDEIDTAFDLTFYGLTVSGKRVQSETASGLMLFNYAATSPARLAR
ncbi:MAG: hypothetical protein ABI837_17520 [Acidobacteriota bacterium]